jgi:hypothetical protein
MTPIPGESSGAVLAWQDSNGIDIFSKFIIYQSPRLSTFY